MWPIWLQAFPSGEVQVYFWMIQCGNIVLLTTRFFDVAQVHYSNTIIITNLM